MSKKSGKTPNHTLSPTTTRSGAVNNEPSQDFKQALTDSIMQGINVKLDSHKSHIDKKLIEMQSAIKQNISYLLN